MEVMLTTWEAMGWWLPRFDVIAMRIFCILIASMTHIRNKDFSISLVRLSHETTRLEHGNPTH